MRKTPEQFRLYLQACDEGKHHEDRVVIEKNMAKARLRLSVVLAKRWKVAWEILPITTDRL